MNKLKMTFKSVVPILVITFSPVILNAAPCCVWEAYGCTNIAIIEGNQATLYTDCGDGLERVGEGLYGGCSGETYNCSLD